MYKKISKLLLKSGRRDTLPRNLSLDGASDTLSRYHGRRLATIVVSDNDDSEEGGNYGGKDVVFKF